MGHICFYLFIFTLRYVIAPFRYLSRPLISAALAPALGAWLSEDIYILAQGLLPSQGFLSSISLSPCLECSPARIVATGGLLRFQVVG